MKRLLLGIDPGLAQIGWGIITYQNAPQYIASGVVKTDKDIGHQRRLAQVYQELGKQILPFHEGIYSAGMETLVVGKNSKTTLAAAEAVGVINLLLHKLHLPAMNFHPNTIKKTITGSGKASKEELAKHVQERLTLPHRKLASHETDALAVALTLYEELEGSF